METISLHPYLFQEYLAANATIPQVSDGIKWWIHNAYLQNPVVSLETFAASQFGQDQLQTLGRVANAIHRANNIPFETTNGYVNPRGITPIVDSDFQILMVRVRHSMVHNLYNFQFPERTYENDFAHDVQLPTVEMIAKASQVITDPTYKLFLEIVVGCIHGENGKDLLKAYRDEFKRGKRTSTVWRADGYGNRFASLVRDAFGARNINVTEPPVRLFLRLNNLSQYSTFGGEI